MTDRLNDAITQQVIPDLNARRANGRACACGAARSCPPGDNEFTLASRLPARKSSHVQHVRAQTAHRRCDNRGAEQIGGR
ncbi:hypothetical protein [Kibdelosporangium philippinense]|uniref:hypothetical protein n=1 Tax=Kibdelosporangium philippinense TaxID=211113 RepID=UPI0036216BEB